MYNALSADVILGSAGQTSFPVCRLYIHVARIIGGVARKLAL